MAICCYCVFKSKLLGVKITSVSLLWVQGGCASVIVSLTVQCPQDLSPYSGNSAHTAPQPLTRVSMSASTSWS